MVVKQEKQAVEVAARFSSVEATEFLRIRVVSDKRAVSSTKQEDEGAPPGFA